MKDFQKTLKVTWFGIKNNKVLFILMLILCCLILPTFTYLNLKDIVEWQEKPMVLKAYGTIVAYICGIISPCLLFSSLHKRIEQDFYNAMPVTRSQYFCGYFLSAAIIFFVPYCLMFVIHLFLFDFCNLWSAFGQPAGMFFVLYCSLTLCMIFCTSKAGAAVTYILRNGLPVSLVLLPFVLASLDTSAYFDFLSDKIIMLTPLGTGFCLAYDYEHILIVQLIIALAELIVSYFLYVKRKNETSLALAFPKTRYFYQYTVMTVAALLLTAFFAVAFGVGYDYGDDRLPYVIFFTAAFSFVVFILLNIIMEKNSKAAFHKIRHLFIFFGGFAIIVTVVVSLLVSYLPYSVLPFTPRFAVVRLYTAEEGQHNDGHWDFGVYVYSNDNENYDENPRWVGYHANKYKTFIVTDKEKLEVLIDCAKDASYYNNNYKNLSLLPSHAPWSVADFYDDDILPTDLLAVEIDFYSADLTFNDEITEDDLKILTSQTYLYGTYRQSTRYGFARGENYILSLADVLVQ